MQNWYHMVSIRRSTLRNEIRLMDIRWLSGEFHYNTDRHFITNSIDPAHTARVQVPKNSLIFSLSIPLPSAPTEEVTKNNDKSPIKLCRTQVLTSVRIIKIYFVQYLFNLYDFDDIDVLNWFNPAGFTIARWIWRRYKQLRNEWWMGIAG